MLVMFRSDILVLLSIPRICLIELMWSRMGKHSCQYLMQVPELCWSWNEMLHRLCTEVMLEHGNYVVVGMKSAIRRAWDVAVKFNNILEKHLALWAFMLSSLICMRHTVNVLVVDSHDLGLFMKVQNCVCHRCSRVGCTAGNKPRICHKVLSCCAMFRSLSRAPI